MKMIHPSVFQKVPAAVLAAAAFAMSSPLNASTIWDGENATNASWGNSTNWSDNVTPVFNNATDLSFPTSAVTQFNTSLGAARTIRSMDFGANVDSAFGVSFTEFFFNGSNARNLTMGGGGSAAITVNAGATGNITLGNPGGFATSPGNLVLAENLAITHNGTGTLLINRPISGAFGITKTGAGTLELKAFNSFTGALNVNGGTVLASTSSTTGQDINSASSINLGGGTLRIDPNSNNKAYDTAPIVVSSASTLAYANASAGTSYNLAFGGAGAFALNANLTVQNLSTNTALANGVNISRNITGAGNLIVEGYNNITSSADAYGLGRILLSGNNNSGWGGNLVVAKGTVSLGPSNTTALVSGTGGIVIGTTADAFGAGLTFFPTTANGTTVTFTNAITVRSGGFRSIKGSGTDHSIELNGALTLEGNLNLDSSFFGGAFDRSLTLGGDISGVGGLDITRAGGNTNTSVILTGTNNYGGGTTVATGATLSVGAGGTTGSITGNVTNDGSLTFNRSDDLSFAGAISGSGSLTKLGAGVLTLAGTSGLTGDTAVNGGTLIVNGSLSSSLNDVSVADGARIGGDGSVASTLSLASGAQFVFSIATTLDVVGAVTLDNSFGVASLVTAAGSLIDWSSVGVGTYTLIGTTTSDFSNVTNFGLANAADLGAGKSAYFQNGSLQLVVVPEPGAFAVFAAGLIVLIVVRRRQLQKQA